MSKKIVKTSHAPEAIGPYSQGVIVNNIVYTSGQIPINPETGKIVEGIAEQTKQSLTNVKAILEEAGSGMDQVFKTTVFLSDMDNFKAMNEVYKGFFTENYPSRSAVQVSRLPLDVLIEIEAIGLIKE